MANSFYSYLAFIQPNAKITFDDIKTNLEEFYANKKGKPTITQSKSNMVLTFKDYQFSIHYSNEKHVIEEAREIADRTDVDWADNKIDKEKLKECSSRFEIWGEEDFDMDYFNDSLFIIETIEKLDGLIIFYVN